MLSTTTKLNTEVKDNLLRLKPYIANKTKNTYLTVILSLLTMSFFGLFAIKPTLSTAVSLNRDIQDLRVLNEQYEEKITTIIKGQSEYEKIRDDIPLIYASVPETAEFSKLIIREENIASTSGITLDSLQIDPVPISKSKDEGNVISFGFSVSGSGDYNGAYGLLLHNLNALRLVNVDQVSMEQEGASDGGQIKINLRAKSYYEP